MIEVKFDLLSEVVYFNTAKGMVEKAKVKGVQIVPTGISKDEKGEDVLEGFVVLYQTMEGVMLSEQECFASEGECKEFYRKLFVEG